MVMIDGELADILCGSAFIVNLDSEDGNFTSLSDDQIERLLPKIGTLVIHC